MGDRLLLITRPKCESIKVKPAKGSLPRSLPDCLPGLGNQVRRVADLLTDLRTFSAGPGALVFAAAGWSAVGERTPVTAWGAWRGALPVQGAAVAPGADAFLFPPFPEAVLVLWR